MIGRGTSAPEALASPGSDAVAPSEADRAGYADIPLYSAGVVVDCAGEPQLVPVGAERTGGWTEGALQDVWLALGTVPGPPRYAGMAEQALRDLEALVLPRGFAIAGLSDGWRYVWPRDASFAAAALAATGHTDDAHLVLARLGDLQEQGSVDDVFNARYLPDGSGDVPDDRGLQLDGNGWVLWAVAAWFESAPSGAGRLAALAELEPLVTRSIAAIRANVGPDGLPTVSADYWEVGETEPTLGTSAALLLGLRAIGPVLDVLGEAPVDDLVAELLRGVEDSFAPSYPRHPGESGRDTAVAFLMPPFAPADDEVTAAWEAAARSMVRPAGGLAPGATWRQDGVSWTPTTAMFALTAAASDDLDRAQEWLDWLDSHRTELGSLPEKVLWDGSPSAVAPLAWTSALVILTLVELDESSGDGGRGPAPN
jgi:glucoamylase